MFFMNIFTEPSRPGCAGGRAAFFSACGPSAGGKASSRAIESDPAEFTRFDGIC